MQTNMSVKLIFEYINSGLIKQIISCESNEKIQKNIDIIKTKMYNNNILKRKTKMRQSKIKVVYREE